jgi:tetratricopeptide (TPR) repeat protein
MGTKTRILPVLSIVAATLLGWPSLSVAQAATTTQDTLNQYVADLQRNPSDTALREKIIKLAQELNPPPAIPEEARRHYVKASTLLDDAKQPSDSADAAEEFRQALLIAPWWGEVYMKMGLALETAQRYDDAIAALKLFMVTNPQGDLQRKTQDEIYKIEARQEKAAKDKELADQKAAAEEARAKAEQQRLAFEASPERRFEALLRKIDGRTYVFDNATMNVRGDLVVWGSTYSGRYHEYLRFHITGFETIVNYTTETFGPEQVTIKISEDGENIIRRASGQPDCIFRSR